jgi:hypothetical protein
MEVRKGMIVGRKKVVRLYNRGPYAWVSTRCTCKHKTVREQPLLSLLQGLSVSCSACFHDDLREACNAVKAQRRVEAEAIRNQFGKVKA